MYCLDNLAESNHSCLWQMWEVIHVCCSRLVTLTSMFEVVPLVLRVFGNSIPFVAPLHFWVKFVISKQLTKNNNTNLFFRMDFLFRLQIMPLGRLCGRDVGWARSHSRSRGTSASGSLRAELITGWTISNFKWSTFESGYPNKNREMSAEVDQIIQNS